MSVSSADATDSDALLGTPDPALSGSVKASPGAIRQPPVPGTPPGCKSRPSPRSRGCPAPPAQQPAVDLIELASSTEDVSLCSSVPSDYRSCDEEGAAGPPDSVHRREERRRQQQRRGLDYGGDVEDEDDECCLPDDPFVKSIVVGGLGHFHHCPSAAQLSVSSSTGSDPAIPTCRICHLPGGEEDGLISPCRCAGTMQHIHSGCLMKWLEVSSRKSKRPPSCELCLYQYHRHKKFKIQHWQFPQCSMRDKVLHALFFLSLLTMVAAATVTILCFKHDKGSSGGGSGGIVGAGRAGQDKNRLTHSEVVTLVCGVLFFVAFFLAMYVEVKAHSTIYKLVVDFLYLNQQWYIDEYDKKTDVQSVPV